ncbi:MAG: GAF domain-containing protein [Bacteroidota bacterium]
METLIIPRTECKEIKYQLVLPQIKSLVAGEPDLIANMANVSAALRETFGFWWVGFYLAKSGSLVLGPFQGPIACTRIPFHKGVCGAAYSKAKTMVVPDVDAFPGHIACSAATRSEIVLPGVKDGKVAWVLDIDSEHLDTFDETDERYLSKVVEAMVAEMV